MQIKTILKKSSIIAFALAGVIMGSFIFAAASNENTSQDNKQKVEFAKNAFGETYGSGAVVDSFKDWPDLVQAYGVDGMIGYIRKSEFDEDMPKSPEEAISKQNKQETRVINLYESDGKTVIGKFEIKPSNTTHNEDVPPKIQGMQKK